MQTAQTFMNDAKRKVFDENDRYRSPGEYGYDRASPLLFQWSRLLQSTVSQAGSWLLSGKFHKQHCAIYRSEGGCYIEGKGDLVLCRQACHFDYGRANEKSERNIAWLITDIVVEWNPEDPIDSMLAAAAKHVGVDIEKLRKAVANSDNGGVFGGDALSSFFEWNPFSKPPYVREYQRFSLVRFGGKSEADVDQQFADEDLGESLLARLKYASKTRSGGRFPLIPMCCSPSRHGGKLSFWVNTGRLTQIDGWKTQKELEAWINSGAMLNDIAQY